MESFEGLLGRSIGLLVTEMIKLYKYETEINFSGDMQLQVIYDSKGQQFILCKKKLDLGEIFYQEIGWTLKW